MSWPPSWDKPHFKQPISRKVQRFIKRTKRAAAEDAEKQKVRRRDKFCRFPLCGCGRMKLTLAVCHAQHKGIGGNPKGDRSTPAKMILLCAARHRENVIAWDRGTLRITPLTRAGYGGPCVWEIDAPFTIRDLREKRRRWVEVGRESARHVFEPFTEEQRRILTQLAEMTI